jgi:hypothetical protein
MAKRIVPPFTTEERIKLPHSPLSSLRIVNDRTLEIIYKDQIEVSLSEMESLQKFIHEISSKRALRHLVILGKETSFSDDAKIFIAECNKSGKGKTIAEAVFVPGISQLFSANFYFLFLEETFPFQFFMELERAKEWLRELETEALPSPNYAHVPSDIRTNQFQARPHL